MDSGQVKTFCDSAAQLLPQLGAVAGGDPAKRAPEDEALLRQLRVAAMAVSSAVMSIPPAPPAMPSGVVANAPPSSGSG